MDFDTFVDMFRSCGSYYQIIDSFIRVEKGLEWYRASVDAFVDIFPEVLGLHPVDFSNSYLWFINQDEDFSLEGHENIGK
jgi:hypothetical protein